MTSSPCKFCEYRHFGCHANCEVYTRWAIQVRKETRSTARDKAALSAMWNYGKWRKNK